LIPGRGVGRVRRGKSSDYKYRIREMNEQAGKVPGEYIGAPPPRGQGQGQTAHGTKELGPAAMLEERRRIAAR